MAFENKQYLDYSGLQTYDAKIKEWVNALNSSSAAELQDAIDALEALVGEGTVDDRVAAAVASIIDSAPTTFDTLKEVADWIETHGEAAAALVQRVAELEEEVETETKRLDDKVDDAYAAIQSISGVMIEAMFYTPVAYDSSKTVAEQIAALGENEKLVIDSATDATIAENITISDDCVIEAEGVEFTGTITVAEGVSANVIGATFSGQVVVQ